jgi:hypothetical protein
MIELENALGQLPTNTEPTKLWSPYREPLAKFLNKYTEEVRPLHLLFLPMLCFCFRTIAAYSLIEGQYNPVQALACR